MLAQNPSDAIHAAALAARFALTVGGTSTPNAEEIEILSSLLDRVRPEGSAPVTPARFERWLAGECPEQELFPSFARVLEIDIHQIRAPLPEEESPTASSKPGKQPPPKRHLRPVPPEHPDGTPPPAPSEPEPPQPPPEPELPPAAAQPKAEPAPTDPMIVLLRTALANYGFNTAHPFWDLAERRGLFNAVPRSQIHGILLRGKRPTNAEIAALNASFPEGVATALEALTKKKPTVSEAPKLRKAGKAPNFTKKGKP